MSFWQHENITLHCGDCLELMQGMDADSVDSIVTDPPYGLKFMGKAWDHGVPGAPFWIEALRVVKPGAHLLAFGGTRTHHRLMCAIEDAGWETTCGHGFELNDDASPTSCDWKFCPYCGKTIVDKGNRYFELLGDATPESRLYP